MQPSLLNPPGGTAGLGMGCLNLPSGTATVKKLVMMLGQSNVIGKAFSVNLSAPNASYANPYAAVRLLQHNAWSVSGNPQWEDYDTDLRPRTGDANGDMGCELSLGRQLDAMWPGQIVIGKMGISGASLATHLRSGGTYPAADPNGPMFTQIIAKIRAWETLTGSALYAICWIQGEEDAQNPDMYAVYEDNLNTNFIAPLRTEFGSTFLFVMNQLLRATGSGLIFRDTQQECANNITSTFMTLADVPTVLTVLDATHYDADSMIELGIRMAAPIITPPAEPNAAIPDYHIQGAFAEGTANISPAWPSNTGATGLVRANDVGFLVVNSFTTQAAVLGTPAGFVEITDSPQDSSAATGGNRLTVFWCRVTQATLDANAGNMPTPTVTDPGSYAIGQIFVFRGCITTGDPWDVTAGDNTGASASTTVTVPGDTSTVANTLIVAICSVGTDLQSTTEFSAWANADLANVREIVDLTRTSGSGGGFGIATGEKATAGAFGATTATLANSSGQARIMIALRGP